MEAVESVAGAIEARTTCEEIVEVARDAAAIGAVSEGFFAENTSTSKTAKAATISRRLGLGDGRRPVTLGSGVCNRGESSLLQKIPDFPPSTAAIPRAALVPKPDNNDIIRRCAQRPGNTVMTSPPPTVFISYSHDNPEHKAAVLELSQRLRGDGIDAKIDQYVKGTPEEKWPRWMLDQIEDATNVLVICSATYYLRFRGRDAPGKGKGADWEGAVITQEIYDSNSKTKKFIPVQFANIDEKHIPEPCVGTPAIA